MSHEKHCHATDPATCRGRAADANRSRHLGSLGPTPTDAGQRPLTRANDPGGLFAGRPRRPSSATPWH
jgi:hypothetical protein